MKRIIFLVILILFILMPETLWAAADDITKYTWGWESNPLDKSIYYLGLIFGKVGTILPGTGNQLLGDIFKVFNIAVLTLGSLVMMYTVVVSTINTAQEGEVMGRKWSSLWIPIRSAAGVSFLLPTATGFSLIQIMMMWVILQGVHAGNAVYNVILKHITAGGSISYSVPVNMTGSATTLKKLFESLVCAKLINEQYRDITKDQDVVVYPDYSNGKLRIGVEFDRNYNNICGELTAATYKEGDPFNRDEWNTTQINGLLDAVQALTPFVDEAVENCSGTEPCQPSIAGVLSRAANAMKSTISNTKPNISPNSEQENAKQSAAEDGWIFTGAYYFKMITPASSLQDYIFELPKFVINNNNRTYDTKRTTVNDKIKNITNKFIEADIAQTLPNERVRITGGPEDPDNFWGPIQRDIMKLSWDTIQLMSGKDPQSTESEGWLFRQVTRGFQRDSNPMKSLRNIGSKLMADTENLFFALIVSAFVLMLGACVLSGTQPLCWGAIIVISVGMPIFLIILSLFWTAGVLLGIYVPIIPFLVFYFSALSWMMMAVESIVAAPIVALGLVSPAAEVLGRASSSVLIVTNIFMRPSLMVVGFIAGSRLVVAAINMLKFGFLGALENAGTYLGIFGGIAIIIMYAGIMLIVIQKCFSLIHVLPDKVIRWIGGQAEQSMAEKAMQEMEQYQKSAAAQTKAVMEKSMRWVGEQVKKAKSGKGGIGKPDVAL